jgi:hypothetical protein
MKTIIRFAIFIFIASAFTACVKSVDVVITPTNPLTGNWVIADASENSGQGWVSFNPGTKGEFSFYGNGIAQYVDASTSMNGNWYSTTLTTGYYDAYGNYNINAHQSFEVQVSNNIGGSLDLYFDDISFEGNDQFITTYFDGKNIERYTFVRY